MTTVKSWATVRALPRCMLETPNTHRPPTRTYSPFSSLPPSLIRFASADEVRDEKEAKVLQTLQNMVDGEIQREQLAMEERCRLFRLQQEEELKAFSEKAQRDRQVRVTSALALKQRSAIVVCASRRS